VPVGTVDKFQGQTAAVVIYSMTTSRPEDARGAGVPVQPEPAQRGDLACALCGIRRRRGMACRTVRMSFMPR